MPSVATAQPPSRGAGVRLVSTQLCIVRSLGLTVTPLLPPCKGDGKALGDPGAKVIIARAMIMRGGIRLCVVTGGICVYPAPNTMTRGSWFPFCREEY